LGRHTPGRRARGPHPAARARRQRRPRPCPRRGLVRGVSRDQQLSSRGGRNGHRRRDPLGRATGHGPEFGGRAHRASARAGRRRPALPVRGHRPCRGDRLGPGAPRHPSPTARPRPAAAPYPPATPGQAGEPCPPAVRGPATTRDLAAIASAGDPLAKRAFEIGARALGAALGGIANVASPEVIVIGGGLAETDETWWAPLREAFAAELIPATTGTPLRKAEMGQDAALLG